MYKRNEESIFLRLIVFSVANVRTFNNWSYLSYHVNYYYLTLTQSEGHLNNYNYYYHYYYYQGRHQVKLRGVLTVVSGTRPPLKNENSSDLGHFKLKMSKMRRKK